MNIQYRFRGICGLAMTVAILPLVGIAARAQESTPRAPMAIAPVQHGTIEGFIVGRDGPTMSVKTADNPRLTVVLSDSTKATEKGGFLGWSRTDPGITALVPGLSVKVEGSYDPDHRLIAQKVTFTRNSMRVAKQVEAGINPTNEKVAAAQDAIRTNQKNIEAAQNAIDANTKDIAKNSSDIAEHTQAIAVNSAAAAENKDAIGKANNRFGALDQYEVKGNITVNFANGKATVSTKDREQLTEFVKAAADTPGFMIQIQGYASSVGSPAVNQRLSAERAEAVTSIIQQTGAVPLTRILAPAAMGTSEQVGDNHKRAGQAQNRRVVVTILVNKGING